MSRTLPADPSSPDTSAKAMRSDGVEARNRLLDAALALFAEKGFAQTSTREIALAAHTNIASISYYFGDKAGLYRQVFADPRGNPPLPSEAIDAPDVTLADALGGMLRHFVEPLKQGHHRQQQCMKLHFREMLEPTGVWQQEIDHNIRPTHEALNQLLCRHLGVAEVDDDIRRLAFSLTGLGIMLHVAGDVYGALCPQLIGSPPALDTYTDRLLTYALAMVEAEARRRSAGMNSA
ncbi:MAG: hypothetical protein RJA34_2888 [Pseudomonadota bacterium]|jgi:AcrR family transcriptional regulator